LFEQLVRLLHELGPWVVFFVAFIETAFFIGLLIPAEATVLVAAFLATPAMGVFNVWAVLAATFFGALLGDQTGYLLGRFGGTRLVAKEGRIARVWRRNEPRAEKLFRRHAGISVTLARFVSFVRTLMPWFAGMSRMPWAKFFFYDVLGAFGWAAASIAVGYFAGESWEAAAGILGRTSMVIISIVLLIALAGYIRKKKQPVKPTRPLRVALTGNIASGKSTVAAVWQKLGAPLIDADVLARAAVARGTGGYDAVVRQFGPDVVAGDGSLDRDRLRDVVFRDPQRRTELEQIVHPEVQRLRTEEEAAHTRSGARIVIHDIPLLYEVGLADQFDVVVLVHADEADRLNRLVEQRGLSETEARAMIAAQMPAEEKRGKAHIVIENKGTLAELEQRATNVWKELQEWPAPSA
jgi:dephospho-CoA kinase